MKAILIAGGLGTRLFPATSVIHKHLIPIYDKPMIYYPLSVLMLSNIKEILIVTTQEALDMYQCLLGNREQFGLSLEYCVQEKPGGLSQALLLGKPFIGKEKFATILADNIFYGQGLTQTIKNATDNAFGAQIFLYRVKNPSAYGVAEFLNGKVISVEEKPKSPKSEFAITGLYLFDETAFKKAEVAAKEWRSCGDFVINDNQSCGNSLLYGATRLDALNDGFFQLPAMRW